MAKYRIGRAEECDVRINDLSISRTHAELEKIGGNRYVLRDLDSTYGTHVYREGEWVEVLEIEIKKDTPLRLGDHRTTVAEMMAGQMIDAEETDRRHRESPGPKAGSSPAPGPGPVSADARRATTRSGRSARNLWLAIGGGAVLMLVAAAATAAILLMRGGATDRERLMAICMAREGTTQSYCACQVDFILARTNRIERDYILFANENPSEQARRDYLNANFSESERRQLIGRLTQIRLGVENQCRRDN